MRAVKNTELSLLRHFANDLKKGGTMLVKCPECGGSLIEEKSYMTTRTQDLGESIGSTTCWVRIQCRRCEACPRIEERVQWRPGWDWSDWE